MNNYIYHGTRNLIVLPNRAVQTFPSGLVRIDRTYACRAGDEGRYRRDLIVGGLLPFDDGDPAIDGAYIFPDTKEARDDSGFVKFDVSSYGRTNSIGTLVEGTFPFSFVQTVVVPSATPRNDIISPIAETTKLSNQLVFRQFPEVPQNESGNYRAFFTERFFHTIFTIDRTNFGFWDECRIVWQRQIDVSVEYVREI